MKWTGAFAAVLPIFLLLGCSNPADGVAEAKVGQASENGGEIPQPSPEEITYFAIDPATSTISFVGSKVTGKHDGGFRTFAGEFHVADGRLAPSGHKVVIATDSIWSDSDRLTRHLKSDDFFDVNRYPTSTFVATSIASSGEGEATVTGNLTLHGITKEIAFPAKITVASDAVRVTAEFFIDRFDFDMKYSGRADDLIRKEVVLKFDIHAKPGRADFQPIESGQSTASVESMPVGPKA